MTQSLTLARLPRAGENSKPPIYKQKKTKNERHFENLCFNGEKFEELKRKKNRNNTRDLLKNPKRTAGPQNHQVKMAFVNSNE